jgi:acyl carrier protein
MVSKKWKISRSGITIAIVGLVMVITTYLYLQYRQKLIFKNMESQLDNQTPDKCRVWAGELSDFDEVINSNIFLKSRNTSAVYQKIKQGCALVVAKQELSTLQKLNHYDLPDFEYWCKLNEPNGLSIFESLRNEKDAACFNQAKLIAKHIIGLVQNDKLILYSVNDTYESRYAKRRTVAFTRYVESQEKYSTNIENLLETLSKALDEKLEESLGSAMSRKKMKSLQSFLVFLKQFYSNNNLQAEFDAKLLFIETQRELLAFSSINKIAFNCSYVDRARRNIDSLIKIIGYDNKYISEVNKLISKHVCYWDISDYVNKPYRSGVVKTACRKEGNEYLLSDATFNTKHGNYEKGLTTYNKLKTIIIEHFAVSESEVKESAHLVRDFHADTIDIVELMMAIEEEFEIEITDNEIEWVRTVGDLAYFLTSRFCLPILKNDREKLEYGRVLNDQGKILLQSVLALHSQIIPDDKEWSGSLRTECVKLFFGDTIASGRKYCRYLLDDVAKQKIEKEMGDLLSNWNQNVTIMDTREEKIKKLAEFHHQFEKIHPFYDGNGRTGRMILFEQVSFLFKNQHLQPFDRQIYYKALQAYDAGDSQGLEKVISTSLVHD